MGIEKKYFEAQYWISSSDVVQHDQRSARNIMAIARTPEDRLKTVDKPSTTVQKPSAPYTPVCVHL
eukprot:9384508-Heterocapsa_arctica.AAC.1